MKFEIGHPKKGGRTPGTPNKTTKALREQLQSIVQTTLDELPETLALMDPIDRAKLLVAVLPYIMPKLNSVNFQSTDDTPKRGKPAWLGMIAKHDGLDLSDENED